MGSVPPPAGLAPPSRHESFCSAPLLPSCERGGFLNLVSLSATSPQIDRTEFDPFAPFPCTHPPTRNFLRGTHGTVVTAAHDGHSSVNIK
ncbi:hypothetical protein JZ751_025518 [Albula glossodonta]|uniref:Uncharacterized protein n=1 Tax=Albula glossodonta TaxID=121402 RepID=A0A8T2NHA7_9TELE|nr:hypothetical protein JZ751_025518 [Albula glossodonta]